MPQTPKVYYDTKKYKLSAAMPQKWSQVVPNLGFKEFQKDYLTDEDCEALIAAGSEYVSRKAA